MCTVIFFVNFENLSLWIKICRCESVQMLCISRPLNLRHNFVLSTVKRTHEEMVVKKVTDGSNLRGPAIGREKLKANWWLTEATRDWGFRRTGNSKSGLLREWDPKSLRLCPWILRHLAEIESTYCYLRFYVGNDGNWESTHVALKKICCKPEERQLRIVTSDTNLSYKSLCLICN